MYKIGRRILAASLCLKTLKYCKNNKSFFTSENEKIKTSSLPRRCVGTERSSEATNESCTEKNADDVITVHNFVQGRLGNCGMIAAMSTLAHNKNLYDKVVPPNQNFDASDPGSKVRFNLYKLGKRHEVWVDKSGLEYCMSSNNNLVGPLLEKALVLLHFDGDYQSARGVSAAKLVMPSLSNGFFEQFRTGRLKNGSYQLNEVVDHGLRTNSQMVVSFQDTETTETSLISKHGYALINENNVVENQIKLYNPHGEILSVDKSIFSEAELLFEICYFGNQIFRMSETKTTVDLTCNWPFLEYDKQKVFVDYDLLIKDDDTEILINVITKPSDKVAPTIFIMTNDHRKAVVKASVYKPKLLNELLYPKSLRENLKAGKYKIVILLSDMHVLDCCEDGREYLENGGNEFLLRLAASKQCAVEKPTKKETDEIRSELIWWRVVFAMRILFDKDELFHRLKRKITGLLWS